MSEDRFTEIIARIDERLKAVERSVLQSNSTQSKLLLAVGIAMIGYAVAFVMNGGFANVVQ